MHFSACPYVFYMCKLIIYICDICVCVGGFCFCAFIEGFAPSVLLTVLCHLGKKETPFYAYHLHFNTSYKPWGNKIYWIDILCFYSLSLSSTAGCWQLSSTVHCKAFGWTQARGQLRQWGQLFSQNQHLFYLTMIWFSLHGNCCGKFFLTLNPLEVVQHIMSKEERFLRTTVCSLCCVWVATGVERATLIPRLSPRVFKPFTHTHTQTHYGHPAIHPCT